MLGLDLIRKDQLHWEPAKGEQKGRVVMGPRGAPEKPMPLEVRATLSPAMSLLEIILQIIAEIIEDFLRARRSEVARDASIAAALRRKYEQPDDPVVAALFNRNAAGVIDDV
ncbi:hypothetical protein [Qingshengfaniella alkalisoli]|uniref:Uncharacterized protein n=1 Tax=Qingshengfaniella alkalisoli TaxID=2599296 RepID=A0A5B8J1Z7_9RHOB|nr:hypothetical protein [Qingshengfaniella alkalisoli]QDY71181.1 hypothetical protein FPZ52_15875 [Qingshengfaniella alkalisoli]